MKWYKIYNGKRIHAGSIDDRWILHTLCNKSYMSTGTYVSPPDGDILYTRHTTPGYGQIITSYHITYMYCRKCLSKYRSMENDNEEVPTM